MKCNWKEASTLILTALKKEPEKGSWNYVILTLQRSLKSTFWPSGFVFPGGTTEAADSDRKWLDLFLNFQINVNFKEISGPIPPILKNQVGEIPKLLSLKIAAIRETFEETGILLCFCKDETEKSSDEWISTINVKNSNWWRSKVQENASEFFNLCLQHECCPDVNKLHLWSNWLTPSSAPKRFDTAFFFASIKGHLNAVPDGKEMQKSLCKTPSELLTLFKCEEIFLPPPQFYEIGRLLYFKDIITLMDFAKSRNQKGCERWMPVLTKTSEGLVSVLPGDDAYHPNKYCEPTEQPEVKMSNKEFRLQSKVLHRLEFLNKRKPKIIIKDYKSPDGHVIPFDEWPQE